MIFTSLLNREDQRMIANAKKRLDYNFDQRARMEMASSSLSDDLDRFSGKELEERLNEIQKTDAKVAMYKLKEQAARTCIAEVYESTRIG